MLPVEEGQDTHRSQPRTLLCPAHTDTELDVFCRNCEVLACSQCVTDHHHHCPGKVPVQEYASSEKTSIKRCRVKYAQVMRFFSEQRRDTEERMAALNVKKHTIQGDIRKFFSALIKACMDVEGSLLEELENSVSDHMDLLSEHHTAWQRVQEDTQELLDITDILHFLPNADFLPLMEASKASLSQALRDGENLAASTPPEMSVDLCLCQSSLRSVVKRIKEIGATSLIINTHKTLTLRKVSSMSFAVPDDKNEPLVTAMLLLTPSVLLAADFNNSCLKRFHKEEEGEGWNCMEVLALKWRPYGMTKLSEECVSLPQNGKPGGGGPESQQDRSFTIDPTTGAEPLSEKADEGMFDGKQASSGKQGDDGTDTDIHLAVTSPLAGCFDVVIPASGNRKMHVVRAIDEEKGLWGLGVVGNHKLAVSTMVSGRSFISLIDTAQGSTQRLPLTSDVSVTPLVSPRHVLPTSPSSIIVGDHGKKAVIHVSLDGQVLFTFTGNGSHRVSHPEGLCVDGQGHVFVADSGDHCIFVLTKGGHLYSRTGKKQSDLHQPQALCIDRNSCLYVANDGGKLLNVYEVFQEGELAE
ncbi:uncharacterized protein LOC143292910 isoform X2 [Babylonia areolata]